MRFLLPEKIHFKGPDPPPIDWKVTEEINAAQAEAVPTSKTALKGK
jgi:hypothetical protein